MSRIGPAFFAVARNTFFEVVRQPAFAVVFVVTLASFAASPALALLTIGDETQLLKDFGLSTLLLSGFVLTCLAAGNVVRREIDDRTTLTLLAKPISRDLFVFAKFAGVVLAVAVVVFVFGVALLFAARAAADLGHDHASHGDSGRGGHGHDHGGGAVDLPILIGGIGGFVLAGLVAIVRAYRSGRSFAGGLVLWCVPIFTVALIFVAVFGPDCEVGDAPVTFDPLLLHGIVLSFFATTIFAAFAVCSSVWVGKGATFCATAALFLLGLWRGGSSNVAETAAGTETYPADAGGGLWSFVPDFQIFWVGDLAYTPEVVPDAVFVTRAGLYAVAFAVTFLAIGALSLRHRSL